MPYVGEEIDILISPYDRYTPPVYDLARVEEVSSDRCIFEAKQYGQPFLTRYEATDGRVLLVLFVGLPLLFLAVVTSYGAMDDYFGFDRYSDETIALGDELQDMRAKAVASDSLEPPQMKSGKYYGETSESDGVVQEASTTLKFGEDGRVTGFGYDSEDGDFQIVDGYWFGTKAVWFEKYGSGWKPNLDSSKKAFKVAVRVDYDPRGESLRGKFCSSVRNIKGGFTLRRG